MTHEVKIGMTDYSVFVFIPDPASTDGSGKTGLVAANLTVSGSRMETDNDATVIDYTGSLNDLAALTTAHTDWGLKEISSTLAPGLYRLDIADAIFASGAWSAVVYVMITTSAAAASPIQFLMIPQSPIDGVKTAEIGTDVITATAIQANAIGAAEIADGAIDAATFAAGAITATVIADGAIDAATFAAGAITATVIADGAIDAATFAAGAITATVVATGAIDADALAADAGTELGTAVWATATRQLTSAQTFNLTGDITGNLSGSVGSVTGAVGSVTGAVGSVTGAVGSVTGNVGGNVTGSVGSLATQAKADVNAEVLDVLATDTYAEPGQGAPAATATLAAKINYLYKAWRNKKEQTSTAFKLYDDAGTTVDQKQTVSDDATTYTRGEIATGP